MPAEIVAFQLPSWSIRLPQFQHIFPFFCRRVRGELQRNYEKDLNLCLFCSSGVLNVLAQLKVEVVI